MITIVSIENVLARGEDLRTAQPTKQAKALYDGLRSQNQTFGLTRAPEEITRWWLKREHLDQWATVMSYQGSSLSWEHWCADQVRNLLAEGWEVFGYVDSDVSICAEVQAMGVAAICVGYPHTAPGWKEVAAPRAWAEIATTVDQSP
jgi:hypothetical protein